MRVSIRSTIKEIPKPSTEEETLNNLILARGGSEEATSALILGHIGLAAALACRHAGKRPSFKSEDILGIAFYTLVETTNRIAAGELMGGHDNFTGYITQRIVGQLYEQESMDHPIPICVGTKSVREQIKVNPDDVSLKQVTLLEDRPDYPCDFNKYHVVVASDSEFAQMYVRDFLENGFLTPVEKTIIQLRQDGFSYLEIGQQLGMTSVQLTRKIQNMKARLLTTLGVASYES